MGGESEENGLMPMSEAEERQAIIQSISRGYLGSPTGAGFAAEARAEELKQHQKNPSERTINFNNVGPPLDYSFMDLTNVQEILQREPVGGHKKEVPEEVKEETVVKKKAPKEEKSFLQAKLVSTGVVLSYNDLSSLEGIVEVLEEIMDDPKTNLRMINLSHNKFTTIPKELKAFPNLSSILLHGNQITDIKQVRRLRANKNLQKLTLNGNEVITLSNGSKFADKLEETRFYKQNIIWTLKDTLLKNLDASALTPKDRQNATIWNKNHRT